MHPDLVLVVDDNEDNRIVLSALLAYAGHAVLQAGDGAEGVRMAQERRPDLILLDLSMPVMDGWEAVRLLRADPRTAAIPVVSVTAHDVAVPDLEAAGFCGYLRKPLAAQMVLDAVAHCLDARDSARGWADAPARDLAPAAIA